MTKIEVVFNDDTCLRGEFTEAKRAAMFLDQTLRNYINGQWNSDDYENIRILIDGIEFSAPPNPDLYLIMGRRGILTPFAKEERLSMCVKHIEYCIRIKEGFF